MANTYLQREGKWKKRRTSNRYRQKERCFEIMANVGEHSTSETEKKPVKCFHYNSLCFDGTMLKRRNIDI